MKKPIVFTLCFLVINAFSFAIEDRGVDFSLERIYSIKGEISFQGTEKGSPKILLLHDIKYDTHFKLDTDSENDEEKRILQYFSDEPIYEENYIYFNKETGKYESDNGWVDLALFLMQ